MATAKERRDLLREDLAAVQALRTALAAAGPVLISWNEDLLRLGPPENHCRILTDYCFASLEETCARLAMSIRANLDDEM